MVTSERVLSAFMVMVARYRGGFDPPIAFELIGPLRLPSCVKKRVWLRSELI